MLLFDWLITMRRLCTGQTPPRYRRNSPRKRGRPAPLWWAAEVLEDRTLLTTLTGIDVGDRIDQAAETGLGTSAGNFATDESINNDVGNTQATARETGIYADPDDDGSDGGRFAFAGSIGNGPLGLQDVDLFQFEALAGQGLTAETFNPDDSLELADTVLRLFDETGEQLAFNNNVGPSGGDDNLSRIDFRFDADGTYFIGVSGDSNFAYDSLTTNGTVDGDIGDYNLLINVDNADDESNDVGDTQAFALDAEIDSDGGRFAFAGFIGNGQSGLQDVDLF